MGPEASERSRECLDHALALDPGFALPYVGLADYHLARTTVGGLRAPDSMPRARELAQRALAIDPNLPEGHAMLGIVAGHYDLDWVECRRRFELARAREPIHGHVRQQGALFNLQARGLAEEGWAQTMKVVEDDPLCQMWHYSSALSLSGLGRHAEALATTQRSVDIDPAFWIGWHALSMLHSAHGRHADALRCAEQAFAAAPWCPYTIGVMGGALEALGDHARAQPHVATLRDDAYRGPAGLILYHAALNRADEALASAMDAIDRKFILVLPLVVRPLQWKLSTSPRWPAFLERARLER
ncbi:MAG TPA: hypothetical protein VL326_03470 [Kofleriaceae bacterium]|nr:hypothetical protein [Kofleriaceae bacterium]